MRLNAKQIGLIAVSLIIAFVINWLLWLVVVGRPNEIGFVYQALVTICLGAVFVHIGDVVLKTEVFK